VPDFIAIGEMREDGGVQVTVSVRKQADAHEGISGYMMNVAWTVANPCKTAIKRR
jgi:hypothetical protein